MKEYRVELPNQPGALSKLSLAMAQNLINVRSIAGIANGEPSKISFVVDQDDLMRATLQEHNINFEEIDLLIAQMPDQAGELGALTEKLAEGNVNIDSIFVLDKGAGKVDIAFSCDKPTDAKLLMSELNEQKQV